MQQQIEFLVDECIRRGCHPDDRDCLTDMTLLMYACKAGANGVGDQQAAANVSGISNGAFIRAMLRKLPRDRHVISHLRWRST